MQTLEMNNARETGTLFLIYGKQKLYTTLYYYKYTLLWWGSYDFELFLEFKDNIQYDRKIPG